MEEYTRRRDNIQPPEITVALNSTLTLVITNARRVPIRDYRLLMPFKYLMDSRRTFIRPNGSIAAF